jgi:DNA-binding transcriptional MerR regulator
MPEKFEPTQEPKEKITKISVPDEEVIDWMKTLQKEGFSSEEIDKIMSNLNATYRKKLRPNFVEEELAKIQKAHLKKHGRYMDPERVEYYRTGLKQRLKEE